MQIFMRVMGFVAGLNYALSRQSINLIPLNWLIIGIAAVMAGVLGQIGLRDHDPTAIPIVIPALIIGGVFLLATLKRNTFFQVQTADSPGAARPEDALFQTRMGFTGKLRLTEKVAQRFLDVPAYATRLDSGALAFVSNIDASTRFSGAVTKSKVGMWISVPRFESSQIESGTLFYGKKPRPALRVGFTEGADTKNQRVQAILSFENGADRDAMSAFLRNQSATSATPLTNSPFSSSTG